MQFPKTDLGTFDGERLIAARRRRPDSGTLLQDISGLLAMLAFCGATGFVLVASLAPGLPV